MSGPVPRAADTTWSSSASAERLGRLAAQHYLTCPDVFFEDPDLDWSTYPEDLMRRHTWRFRWD
ncbi:DUF4253 domain-containing protein [Streptomyces tauricus]|uniref:DUF4253 domain-containing protein n=1 Tax=Streptomyces tauricus TaxID=68274 RepID=UPI00339F93E6